jgi:hypothetical protein
MKSMLMGVIMGAVMLLTIFSCATVPTEPLGPGEVRLLAVNFPDPGEVKQRGRCVVNIEFETAGNSEITRVYVGWGGSRSHYIDKINVNYANRLITVDIPTPDSVGSYGIKTYVYYARDGKIQQSNVVETSVNVKSAGSQHKVQ